MQQAQVRWWYRRFYEETDAGRLTTLREDVDLYHYMPEWKERQLIAADIRQVGRSLRQLHTLTICVLERFSHRYRNAIAAVTDVVRTFERSEELERDRHQRDDLVEGSRPGGA